jgi:mono/diheme cytochrome c family protein
MPIMQGTPMSAVATRVRATTLALLGLACLATQGAAGDETLKPGKSPSKDAVTFNTDVAPIVFQQCSFCHRPGEVAPFSLLTYRDVSKRAKLIQSVTHERTMPPWKAEPGFGRFADERRLSDEQIAKIDRWVESGAPEGDPADAPKSPQFVEGWQTGEPDMVLKMAEPYTLAAEGRDEYRCFVLPLKVPAGKYIQSIEFRPGNRRIVHHAVLTAMPHAMAQARLDRADGKSFVTGLAPPGQLLPGPLAIWTPGRLPRPLPAELASEWKDGADLVVQLHLHPSGKPETEQSLIGVHFTDRKPSARLNMMMLNNERINIPAGKADHVVKTSRTLRSASEIYGVFPHMHLIGKSVKVTAVLPDGTTQPLISIGDWDFNWQFYYQYTSPLRLPAGTKLEGEFTYDNSAANPANPSQPPKDVSFGEQTTDEMAIVLIDTINTGPPPKAPTAEEMAKRAEGILKRVDKDGDGKLDLAELTALTGGFQPKEDLEKLLVDFDKDGDKKLDAKELVEALKSMTGGR